MGGELRRVRGVGQPDDVTTDRIAHHCRAIGERDRIRPALQLFRLARIAGGGTRRRLSAIRRHLIERVPMERDRTEFLDKHFVRGIWHRQRHHHLRRRRQYRHIVTIDIRDDRGPDDYDLSAGDWRRARRAAWHAGRSIEREDGRTGR